MNILKKDRKPQAVAAAISTYCPMFDDLRVSQFITNALSIRFPELNCEEQLGRFFYMEDDDVIAMLKEYAMKMGKI